MERFAALHSGYWLDFCQGDDPMCPHCGVVKNADDEEGIYEEGSHHIECNGCGLEYWVYTIVRHSFSTHEQPDDKSRKP